MNTLHSDLAPTPVRQIHYTLRIASAMCFIGHGAFGIITKPIWCNYFAVFGIGHDMAYQVMPVVGTLDIVMGISLLIYPTRAILAWLVAWGIITASLRPVSHEPFGELIERAGNFGAPLGLLLLSEKAKNGKDWFTRVKAASVSTATLVRVTLCLRVVVFLLLAGHGWLNLIEKEGLLAQYQSLGFADPHRTAIVAGCFEILAAVAILVRPVPGVLMALLVWKMGTELFYPHWEIFEWVERGGSYGSILALWLAIRSAPHWITGKKSRPASASSKRQPRTVTR